MFRFIIGLISGIAIGVAAASMSQGQSGQDLRAKFERIRNDLKQGDFDALGAHLEERFKELQAGLESRFAEAAKVAEDAVDDVADDVMETAEAVEEEVQEAVEEEAKKA